MPKRSEKQESVPAHQHVPKGQMGILIRVRQLLARAHMGHPSMLTLPLCALLDVPTKQLVDLIGLNVIVNILSIGA